MAFSAVYARSNDGISNEELARQLPALFSAEPSDTRSSAYQFVSTQTLIDTMRGEGFVPTYAAQVRSRLQYDRKFSRHMLRFRHRNHLKHREEGGKELGGILPEIVMINSHNGSSSYKIMSGLIRFVCMNGLIIADNAMGGRVRHMGENTLEDVVKVSQTVLENSVKGIDFAKRWHEIRLAEHARKEVAKLAHMVRFGEEPDTVITPDDLLKSRRSEDRQNDLWTTFNVIQENAIRGGLQNAGVHNGRFKISKTKEVGNIMDLQRINQGLWEVCEKFATA